MTTTPPAARQWYRLNEQGMPERVSDDYAYAHRDVCYDSWGAAREESIGRAQSAFDDAHMKHLSAQSRLYAALDLPETDPHG